MTSTKIFLKGNCHDKGMVVNELAFLDSALKAVMHGSNESEAKIQIFSEFGTNFRRDENQK